MKMIGQSAMIPLNLKFYKYEKNQFYRSILHCTQYLNKRQTAVNNNNVLLWTDIDNNNMSNLLPYNYVPIWHDSMLLIIEKYIGKQL
jgi:hypothetical protein